MPMSVLPACLLFLIFAALPAADPALTLRQSGTIVHAGGGVRGIGMLASYPAPGLRLVEITRTTAIVSGEAYLPICIVRVLDPQGRTVAWKELTEQASGTTTVRLAVPGGSTGIWRISVSGGRNNDQVTIAMPATSTWGVRGEMHLGGVAGDWWMWVPAMVTKIIVKSASGAPGVTFRDGSGGALATTSPQSGLMVLSAPPTNAAMQVRRTVTAVAFDGVPGLVCPDRASAEALRGGTVTVGGWELAGPLQARARAWMVSAATRPLLPTLSFPSTLPTTVVNPRQVVQLYGDYAPLSGLTSALAKQVSDPTDPEFGAFNPVSPRVDWRTFLHSQSSGHFDASGLAAAVTCAHPLNPAAGNAVLSDRATLSAFRSLVAMQGDDLLRENDLIAQRDAMTYSYFTYAGSLAQPFRLLAPSLDAEAKAIWRDGLIAVGDRLADQQGYQSNQFMHTIYGHLATYEATGETRFLGYFTRLITAFIAGSFGTDNKFGQHPAGYFLEEYGPDGNYDGLSGSILAACINRYAMLSEADPVLLAKLRAALVANQRFKSLFWLPDGDGELRCATQFNTRHHLMLSHESHPVAALAQADQPLARRRHMLTQERANTFPASVFPCLVTSDDWAMRILARSVPRGNTASKRPSVEAFWTADAWDAMARPIVASPARMPWEDDGVVELPGVIAWRRGPLYGTIFHDVEGTGANRILAGRFGGGPTQMWSPGLGLFLAGERNANPAGHGTITAPDHVTHAGLFGTTSTGTFFSTGSERTARQWLNPGRHLRLTSTARAPLGGSLTWDYRLQWGAVAITVRLDSSAASAVWLNLPLPVEGGAGPLAISGSAPLFHVRRGGAPINLVVPNHTAVQTSADLAALPSAVRCLRVPLTADGRGLTTSIAWVLPVALPAATGLVVRQSSDGLWWIDGASAADGTVQITVDGSPPGQATVGNDGRWTWNFTGRDPSREQSVAVRIGDAYGRSSSSVGLVVAALPAAPPVVPAATPGDSGSDPVLTGPVSSDIHQPAAGGGGQGSCGLGGIALLGAGLLIYMRRRALNG